MNSAQDTNGESIDGHDSNENDDKVKIPQPVVKEIQDNDTRILEQNPVTSITMQLKTCAISVDEKLEGKLSTNNKFTVSTHMDMKKWISFTCTQTTTESELREWLENHQPTKPCYQDVGWISIDWNVCELKDKSDNVEQARHLWEQATEKTFQTITEIAKGTDILEGKWILPIPSNHDSCVNSSWMKIAMAIWNKQLGANVLRAKVSAFWEDSKQYCIQIYTENFQTRDEVLSCEKELRNLGIFRKLLYKPEILTVLGINSDEHQNITPSRYCSYYDVTLRKSKIFNSKGNTIEF